MIGKPTWGKLRFDFVYIPSEYSITQTFYFNERFEVSLSFLLNKQKIRNL